LGFLGTYDFDAVISKLHAKHEKTRAQENKSSDFKEVSLVSIYTKFMKLTLNS